MGNKSLNEDKPHEPDEPIDPENPPIPPGTKMVPFRNVFLKHVADHKEKWKQKQKKQEK